MPPPYPSAALLASLGIAPPPGCRPTPTYVSPLQQPAGNAAAAGASSAAGPTLDAAVAREAEALEALLSHTNAVRLGYWQQLFSSLHILFVSASEGAGRWRNLSLFVLSACHNSFFS